MREANGQILEHIVSYCDRVAAALERFGNSEAAFLADNFYQDGVSMCIMQIGELTKKLSPEFRVATERKFHWKAIAGMRDRYAHGYLEMNAKIIWVTASQDLPVLRKQCADLLEQARALQSEESKEE